MRLFTALWPPASAIDALTADVGNEVPRGWRRTDVTTWHVTLAFHGEADPGVSARRLESAAHGLAAPRLRLAGAGAFDGVRWAGVEVDGSLDALVTAAGGDVGRFVAHVTVLRRRPRPGPDPESDPATPWSGHRGPWWRPGEVLLVASEPGRGGMRYRVVHRVPLGPSPGLPEGNGTLLPGDVVVAGRGASRGPDRSILDGRGGSPAETHPGSPP